MPKKKIIIAIIVVIALGFLAIIFYSRKNLFFPATKEAPPKEAVNKEQGGALTQADKYKQISEAIKNKNPQICLGVFAGAERAVCLYDVAQAKGDAGICKSIEEAEIKKKCEELFVYRQIIAGADAEACLNLTLAEFRNQCLTEFFRQWEDAKKCADFVAADKEQCEDIINGKLAFNKGDAKICDNIKSEISREDCKAVVANKLKDTDGDELPDSHEISYGLNPFNFDSDGDGYNDGEEAKTGHNPLGEN